MKQKPEHINCKAFVLYLEHFQCKNTAYSNRIDKNTAYSNRQLF